MQVHERELRLSDTRVETQVQVPAWSQHTLERDKEVEWGKWSFLYTTTLDTTLSVAETHVIVTAVQCLRLSSRSSGLCSPPGGRCSGQVLVQVGVVGVTLEVLTRDEVLDALLDLRG